MLEINYNLISFFFKDFYASAKGQCVKYLYLLPNNSAHKELNVDDTNLVPVPGTCIWVSAYKGLTHLPLDKMAAI